MSKGDIMFFIFGINQKEEKINYNSNLFIHSCGKYGRIEIYKTYMTLSIFFIPTFKWSKKYYVKYNCCNEVYELDKSIGERIQSGENLEIKEEYLINFYYKDTRKVCSNCGSIWNEFYEFCPKCGNKL